MLITDLRRSGWSKDVTRAANDLAADRIALRIVDVGDRRTDNIALLRFELEDAIPLPDQPIHLGATIRNQTAATIKGEQATLAVDGDRRPVLLPDLPPGASTNVPLTLTLDKPGPHTASLALGADALPQDNVRYLAIDVRPTVSVLLIDGRRRRRSSNRRPISWRSPIRSALGLGASSDSAHSIRGGWFPGPPMCRTCWCWPTSMRSQPSRSRSSSGWSRGGMGLMIFSGDLVDVDLYNQRLYREGRGLLPAKLERTVEMPTTGLVIEKNPQSPLAPLAKLVPALLASIHLQKYTAVTLATDAARGSERVGSLEQCREPAGRAAKGVRPRAGVALHMHGEQEVDRLAGQ